MASKIAADKKKHFYVGIPLGWLLQFIASWLFAAEPVIAISVGFAALVAICYGFELFSLVTGKGHADHLDAIAGIIGGVIGMGLYLLFKWCIHC